PEPGSIVRSDLFAVLGEDFSEARLSQPQRAQIQENVSSYIPTGLLRLGQPRSVLVAGFAPLRPGHARIAFTTSPCTSVRQFWHEDRKSTRLNSSHQIISYAV